MLADYLDSALHVTRLAADENRCLPGPHGKICGRGMFSPRR
jgi:hypothetical protein